jgi:signal transduction histidine kinase
VCLWVVDTGAGVSPASMAHLFEPFNRLGQRGSADPGTGLELLLARTVAQAMGGRLSVSSEEGAGTRVCLDLGAA